MREGKAQIFTGVHPLEPFRKRCIIRVSRYDDNGVECIRRSQLEEYHGEGDICSFFTPNFSPSFASGDGDFELVLPDFPKVCRHGWVTSRGERSKVDLMP